MHTAVSYKDTSAVYVDGQYGCASAMNGDFSPSRVHPMNREPAATSGKTEIPLCEARELLKLCEPGIIDKTRYLVRSGQHVFEVDEFYGENEGLTVAEVELSSEDEPFVKPAFIGREVTGDVRYYNSQLMKHPFTTW